MFSGLVSIPAHGSPFKTMWCSLERTKTRNPSLCRWVVAGYDPAIMIRISNVASKNRRNSPFEQRSGAVVGFTWGIVSQLAGGTVLCLSFIARMFFAVTIVGVVGRLASKKTSALALFHPSAFMGQSQTVFQSREAEKVACAPVAAALHHRLIVVSTLECTSRCTVTGFPAVHASLHDTSSQNARNGWSAGSLPRSHLRKAEATQLSYRSTPFKTL